MFRFLFQFIALLLFFAVARSVITWILKNVVSAFRSAARFFVLNHKARVVPAF